MAWPEMFPEFLRLHFKIFFLVFASYTLYYTSQKTFVNVKTNISSYEEISETFVNSSYGFLNTEQAILLWGSLDSVFLVSYAVGLCIIGVIRKWISLRWVMGLGMCFSAIAYVSFDILTKWPMFYNKWFYFFMWALKGLLEASAWPCLVAIVETGFDIIGDGFIFGLWSACASFGNFLGAYIAYLLIQYNHNYTFWVTAAMQFTAGLTILFSLWLSPEDPVLRPLNAVYDVQEPEEPEEEAEDEEEEELLEEDSSDNEDDIQLMNFFAHENHRVEFNEEDARLVLNDLLGEGNGNIVLLEDFFFNNLGGNRELFYPQLRVANDPVILTGVLHPVASVIMMFAKYFFFLWLPFYVNTGYGSGKVPVCEISIWYCLQQIVTGTFQGYLSTLGQQTSVLTLCILMTMASLFGYNQGPRNKVFNAVLMSVTGLLIGTPREVMASSIYNQASIQEQMEGTKEALAVFAGIVDRTVSMGTTVVHYLTSLIHARVGWMGPYYFMVVMVGSSVVLLSLLVIMREIRNFVQRRRNHPLRE